METIRIYLDNMFTAFPTTREVLRIKEDLLSTMEDKYNELKQSGKTENEAVGIVISEFGNIDELMQEMNLQADRREKLPTISREDAIDFLRLKKSTGLLIAIGVFLCITAPAAFIAVTQILGNASSGDVLGIVLLFLLVAFAVALFIYSGYKTEKYKYLESVVDIPPSVTAMAQSEKNAFAPIKIRTTIGSIVCILLSPICLFLLSEAFPNSDTADTASIVFLLMMVACGVFGLVYTGSISSGHDMLLQVEDYSVERKKNNKMIGALASVWWPIATCLYLFWSFSTGNWHISWIVWPISGILFGAICGAYHAFKAGR